MSIRLADDQNTDNARTLSEVEANRDFRISVLKGPSRDRLRDLGFCEQMQVRKLSGGRNLICSVSGTRLAISKALADQVFVLPLA
jgi:Fe2+ transport system protein FeoA